MSTLLLRPEGPASDGSCSLVLHRKAEEAGLRAGKPLREVAALCPEFEALERLTREATDLVGARLVRPGLRVACRSRCRPRAR